LEHIGEKERERERERERDNSLALIGKNNCEQKYGGMSTMSILARISLAHAAP
jgi:hypothetical protein